jgi:hypothetical protein
LLVGFVLEVKVITLPHCLLLAIILYRLDIPNKPDIVGHTHGDVDGVPVGQLDIRSDTMTASSPEEVSAGET